MVIVSAGQGQTEFTKCHDEKVTRSLMVTLCGRRLEMAQSRWEDGDEEVASDGDEDSAGEEPTPEEDEVEELGGEDAPPQCCQAGH